MQMNKLVSIIVPAYNVELYIERCLRSIIDQTYSYIEIIVVIDGAKDQSEEIARHIAEEDDRISVFWQENAGSGPARNFGLKYARGDYIMFVDPDDWIESQMLETLLNKMEKANVDLVTSGCITDLFKDGQLVSNTVEAFIEEEIVGIEKVRGAYLRLFNMGALSAPTKKLYKKAIIDSYQIRFPDLRRSQDIVFNYRYYDCIKSVFVCSESYYHYRVDDMENEKKIPSTYYKNIEFIYNDVSKLINTWGIDNNSDDFIKYCDHFFFATIALLRTLSTVEEVKNVTSSRTIRDITKFARPVSVKRKVIRVLILARANWILKLIISLYK